MRTEDPKVVYDGRMDYSQWYTRVSAPFRGRVANALFGFLDGALVGVFIAEYVTTVALLFQKAHYLQLVDWDMAPNLADVSPIAAIAVPAFVLVAASLLRAHLNRPRPYEEHDITPLLARDLVKQQKHGESLPSRHMSCAVIIALLFCLSWPGIATVVVQVLLCAGIAFTRVVGGVHYPRDIVAAIALALVCGAVGFALVP